LRSPNPHDPVAAVAATAAAAAAAAAGNKIGSATAGYLPAGKSVC